MEKVGLTVISVQDLHVLFDTIIDVISGSSYNPAAPFQMLVSDLGYSD